MTDLDNGDAAPKVDTSAEYIAKVIHAAPFADNEAGIPQMVDLIKALAAERDALQSAQSYAYIGKDGKTVLARDLEDERDDLRAIIAEFRDIRMTVVYPPDDQDGEPQAVMDLSTWQAWQDDARAALASTKGG